MSKLILYIFVIPFIIWALDSVNINVIFKLGKQTNYQARVLYMAIIFSLSYLVVSFLYDFMKVFSNIF